LAIQPGVACFKHGCFLLDACWRCGALLDPLAQIVPSDGFLCVRCSAPLAGAPCRFVPDSVRDQAVLYRALDRLVAESEHEVAWGAQDHGYVGWREHHYVPGFRRAICAAPTRPGPSRA
jgi:hypothetical protein